jgi:hypothetical protein
MARPNSSREAPVSKNARAIKSRDTLGSPDSIFATRDWLDFISFASVTCDIFWPTRRSLSALLKESRASTNWLSAGESSRNSATVPILNPAASNLNFFFASISPLIQGQPRLASVYDVSWCRLRLLLEYLEDHNCVSIDFVNNPPRQINVLNSQFMASMPNGRHRSGVRQSY